MTVEELETLFEKHRGEYAEFSNIPETDRRHPLDLSALEKGEDFNSENDDGEL